MFNNAGALLSYFEEKKGFCCFRLLEIFSKNSNPSFYIKPVDIAASTLTPKFGSGYSSYVLLYYSRGMGLTEIRNPAVPVKKTKNLHP